MNRAGAVREGFYPNGGGPSAFLEVEWVVSHYHAWALNFELNVASCKWAGLTVFIVDSKDDAGGVGAVCFDGGVVCGEKELVLGRVG